MAPAAAAIAVLDELIARQSDRLERLMVGDLVHGELHGAACPAIFASLDAGVDACYC